MKKTVKGLIVAASVAAVVGVGAVSYAAWSAGDAATAPVSGTTGAIVTVGSITATATGLDKLLVPHDQDDQWDATTMTKGFSVVVAYTGGTGTPTITMQAAGKADAGNNIAALDVTKLEYSTTESGSYTAFEVGKDVPIATGTYYFRLNSDAAADMNSGFTITFTAAATAAE